jgi:MFS transporter, FHS family, L-fucose permease
MQSTVMGLGQEAAGKHVTFYWGGAMVGRFIGAYVLRQFSPGTVLAAVGAAVIALLVTSANSSGMVSGWSLLAIGVVPWITGHAADWLMSRKLALAAPALSYAGILGFGIFARKPRAAADGIYG